MKKTMNHNFAQSTMNSTTRFYRNLIVKVDTYLPEQLMPNCYQGTVKGVIVGGHLDGQHIEAGINKTSSNTRVTKISDFGNSENYSFTAPKGYIAFNSVNVTQGQAQARWANKFANPEANLYIGVPTKIAPVYDSNTGSSRKYKANNETMYKATVLNINETVTPPSIQQLYDAVTQTFNSGGNVYLAQHFINGDRINLSLRRPWRDGELVSIEEAILKSLHDPHLAKIEECLKEGGKIDVIPIETFYLSSKVAEAANQKNATMIKLQEYLVDGFGARIESALKQVKEVNSKDFEKELFASISNQAKNRFAEFGWRGIKNSEFIDFFKCLDIQPKPQPMYGFANSTLHIHQHTSDKGRDIGFVWKARALGPTVPLDFIPTPSSPYAINRYYKYFKDLVKLTAQQIDIQKENDFHSENIPRKLDQVLENSTENNYTMTL